MLQSAPVLVPSVFMQFRWFVKTLLLISITGFVKQILERVEVWN